MSVLLAAAGCKRTTIYPPEAGRDVAVGDTAGDGQPTDADPPGDPDAARDAAPDPPDAAGPRDAARDASSPDALDARPASDARNAMDAPDAAPVRDAAPARDAGPGDARADSHPACTTTNEVTRCGGDAGLDARG